MTPQEAEIIRSVFTRLKGLGEGPRDAEAEGLVEAQMRADPHAALTLVRALVMTDRALAERSAEVERLTQELASARGGASAAAPAGGGLFDGPWGRSASAATGVPTTAPAQPMPQPSAAPAGPWGGRVVDAGGPWGAPAPQGGGFWGSALRTGAGVAGGLLAVEALKGLFGGGHGGHQAGLFGGGNAGAYDPSLASGLFEAPQTTIVNETVNVFQGGGEAARTAAGTGDSGGFGGEPAIDPAAFDGEIDDVGFDDDSYA